MALQGPTNVGLGSGAPPIADHELLRIIGSGAFGTVWLARHTRLGTLRAIKIVRRDHFHDARPFQREFSGLQKYEPISRGHPNLVSILHVGGSDECFYCVMELADPVISKSCSLSGDRTSPPKASPPPLSAEHWRLDTASPRTVRSEFKQHSVLPIDRVLEIGHALAGALAHLHAHKLVHRDVKPSNVIFVGGVAKLADIGLVACVDEARSLVGTEGYTPLDGLGTPGADCYALGKLLYELSTGHDRSAWPEPPADLAVRADRERLRELNAVLHKACAPQPRERYDHAGAMLADLSLLVEGRSVKRRQRWQRRFQLGRRLAWATAAVGCLVITGWLAATQFGSRTSQRANRTPTLAVLPFDEEDAGEPGDNLGERLAENLSANLSRVPGLRVLARTSAIQLKKSGNTRQAIEQSGVTATLEGRVRRSRGDVHLVVELNDPRVGAQLWAANLPVNTNDLFALQIEVFSKLPEALGLRLSETQKARLMVGPTENLEAQRAYWEGRHAMQNLKSFADIEKARTTLRKATQLDPRFALAFAQLAMAYQTGPEFADQPPNPNLTLAREAVSRALVLDPNLPEAHMFLGMIKESYDYDWAEAEREYRRAIELNPAFADGRMLYATLLLRRGREQEAKEQLRIAGELDPFSGSIFANMAFERRGKGEPEQAIQLFKRALELGNEPDFHRFIAETYMSLGRDVEALKSWEDFLLARGEPLSVVEALRVAHSADGWRGYWNKRLEQVAQGNGRYTTWYLKAEFHARLGSTDLVFECLEKSYRNREYDVGNMNLNEDFKPFRSDPRFKELLRKMNMEP